MIYGIHAPSKNAILRIDPKRRHVPALKALADLAQNLGIPVQPLTNPPHDINHQGVVLEEEHTPTQRGERELLAFLDTRTSPLLLLVLDGITDPHNLGACLRSADASGVDAVIVPKDRACTITPVVRKVASGAAESVDFFSVSNLARTLNALADRGVWVVGLDDKASHTLYEEDLRGDTALVLGSEGSGVRRLTKERCQSLVSLPMAGTVSSLNVSVCAGVVLFEVVRQRRKLS
jgi:23S rRNA (guanosine2251-2'-O)-methyltransferase